MGNIIGQDVVHARKGASAYTEVETGVFAFRCPDSGVWSEGGFAVLFKSLPASHPHIRHCFRVPEELPALVEDLRKDCMDIDPKKRPTAREIYLRLASQV